MKQIIILIVLFFLFSGIKILPAQQTPFTYSKVEITIPNRVAMRNLAHKGLIFDHVQVIRKQAPSFTLRTIVNNMELDILKQSGLSYSVLVPDVIKDYQQRQALRSPIPPTRSDTPAGFELGSMGGYYTFDEVVTELDSMHLNHPDLAAAKQSIGLSIENRDLWMTKISHNVSQDEEEPEVFYTALHHAREPAGMMALMYFMDYLLDRYGSDDEVTYLLDHRALFFVPVVNPDGYVYNQQEYPDGGGQWRKNRRDNGNGWYGVDLNRNYGYEWGYDDEGSSPYPFSDTYRGTGPFSEPETQAIRDFVQSRHFTMALNYHTYSDLLIYPWGYVNALTPDSETYKIYATLLTAENRYNFGTGEETVHYTVNGNSDDWLYGEQTSKNKVFALTPEVGTSDDGFWPDPDRIVPLCKENLRANLDFAWLAGGRLQFQNYRIIADDNQNGFADAGETVQLVCRLKNIGRGAAPNISISLLSDDPYVQSDESTNTIHYDSVSSQKTLVDTFTVQVQSDASQGHAALLYVRIDQDGYAYRDTLRGFVLGTPSVLFWDNAENGTSQWNTGQGWDTVATDTGHCFTDSPHGQYADNADNALTLNSSLSLPSDRALYLTYRVHWDIERPFDFGTVEISTDGSSWQTLQSKSMVSASGKGEQQNGTFGYDGFSDYWHNEWIDLSDFQGESNVRFRFRLQSDGGTRRDGLYVDDIRVLAYTGPSAIAASGPLLPKKITLLPNYPNPFNMHTTVRFFLPQAQATRLQIVDVNGRLIRTLKNRILHAGWHRSSWDGKNNHGHSVHSGIYFLSLKAGEQTVTRKIVLLK